MNRIIVVALMTAVSTLALAQVPTPPMTTPDDRALTGVRNLGLGSDSEHENVLNASVSVSESAASNPGLAASAGDNWAEVSGLSGSAVLSRLIRTSNTDLSYHGGASFYSSNSGLNTQTHQLGIAETLALRRWSVTLADNLNYLSYGGGSLPALGLNGNDSAGISNQYLANGTILTPSTTQLANSSVAELDYSLTRNTSLTATGSYAQLDSLDSSLLDTRQWSFGGGLNHDYGRNTVGVNYSDTEFQYQNQPESMQTHAVALSFARRVSARYSLNASAGPEVLISKSGNQSTTQILPSAHFSLLWRNARTNASLAYSYFVTNGSGVTTGAKTHQVTALASRAFGRNVTLSGSAGYARNAAIVSHGETFDTVNALGGISRRFWRNASIAANYYYQRQISTGAFNDLQSHTITCTFAWSFFPVHFK